MLPWYFASYQNQLKHVAGRQSRLHKQIAVLISLILENPSIAKLN